MNPTQKALKLQEAFIGKVLTFGELSLSQNQFRAFKKLVFDHFHHEFKPQFVDLMKTGQVMGSAKSDNLDGKEE